MLQVHYCYATEGPMKLAAALMAGGGGCGDCLAQVSHPGMDFSNPDLLDETNIINNSSCVHMKGIVQQLYNIFCICRALCSGAVVCSFAVQCAAYKTVHRK